MSKKHKPISEYDLKDDQFKNFTRFKTIQRSNDNQERVFVRNFPVENPQGIIRTANIVDKPEDTNWAIKTSHIVDVRQEQQKFIKDNYAPAISAGSFCAGSGTFNVLKEPTAQVIAFPLDPLNPKTPVTKCEFIGNMATGSLFMGSVDAPTWIGYATTSGTITLLR